MERTDATEEASRLRPVISVVAAVALALWVAWWIDALLHLRLRWAELTQIRFPAFGADFWTQAELGARAYAAGRDPHFHLDGRHLVHYPPLVIWLFLWVVPLGQGTALRVWIVVLIALAVLGAVVAHRVRARLGLERMPLVLALVLVLYGFPVLFEIERGNFDLLALAAILGALPLLARRGRLADVLGGAVLAVAPWVKIYPGLLGLSLLALRRFRAFAAFVVAAIAIGLAAPAETVRSLLVLHKAAGIVAELALNDPGYWPWIHSLSLAWAELTRGGSLASVSGTLVAAIVVLAGVSYVCVRVHRCGSPQALTYPLVLWTVSAASFVPLIANDYSLAFLPLAGVAVWSRRDGWLVHGALLLSAVWWQPFSLPLGGWVLLPLKVLAVVAVGASLLARAREADG